MTCFMIILEFSLFQASAPKFPVVIKIGHAHSGVAKVKVDTLNDFQVYIYNLLTRSLY